MNDCLTLLIRKATAKDATLIHEWIGKLADFEDLRDHLVSTPADLRHALSGSRPLLEAHIAEVDGQVAGISTFTTSYSTFAGKPNLYLEDIFVDEAHRGGGVAQELLAALESLARERGCGRLDLQVLDWNERAQAFYRKNSFAPVTNWLPYSKTI